MAEIKKINGNALCDETARVKADEAKTTADEAKSLAETAGEGVTDAKTAAEMAQRTADEAKTTADEAKTAADEAKTATESFESMVQGLNTEVSSLGEVVEEAQTTANKAFGNVHGTAKIARYDADNKRLKFRKYSTDGGYAWENLPLGSMGSYSIIEAKYTPDGESARYVPFVVTYNTGGHKIEARLALEDKVLVLSGAYASTLPSECEVELAMTEVPLNVQADWNESDTESPAYIQNRIGGYYFEYTTAEEKFTPNGGPYGIYDALNISADDCDSITIILDGTYYELEKNDGIWSVPSEANAPFTILHSRNSIFIDFGYNLSGDEVTISAHVSGFMRIPASYLNLDAIKEEVEEVSVQSDWDAGIKEYGLTFIKNRPFFKDETIATGTGHFSDEEVETGYYRTKFDICNPITPLDHDDAVNISFISSSLCINNYINKKAKHGWIDSIKPFDDDFEITGVGGWIWVGKNGNKAIASCLDENGDMYIYIKIGVVVYGDIYITERDLDKTLSCKIISDKPITKRLPLEYSPHTAGKNIKISDTGEISATDTTYTAGDGIAIEDGVITADVSGKLDKENPVATGSFSLGRKSGTTVGVGSFAVGGDTSATKEYSTAFGSGSLALGLAATAEGYQTIASGHSSHAEGYGTIANGIANHVQGMYNVDQGDVMESDYPEYLHIVGNGSSDSSRSNAHTLDRSGNAWFSGDVYVGSTSGTNKDDGSVKLAKVTETVSTADTATEATEFYLKSSTADSEKRFKITVDDTGALTATEVV